jgi:aminopeptidase N
MLFSLYPDTSRLSRYIKPLAEQMSTAKDLRELKDLIAAKPKAFEKATQGVKQALETVALNNQWKINTYMDLSRRLNRMLLRDFEYNDFEDEAEEETRDI